MMPSMPLMSCGGSAGMAMFCMLPAACCWPTLAAYCLPCWIMASDMDAPTEATWCVQASLQAAVGHPWADRFTSRQHGKNT